MFSGEVTRERRISSTKTGKLLEVEPGDALELCYDPRHDAYTSSAVVRCREDGGSRIEVRLKARRECGLKATPSVCRLGPGERRRVWISLSSPETVPCSLAFAASPLGGGSGRVDRIVVPVFVEGPHPIGDEEGANENGAVGRVRRPDPKIEEPADRSPSVGSHRRFESSDSDFSAVGETRLRGGGGRTSPKTRSQRTHSEAERAEVSREREGNQTLTPPDDSPTPASLRLANAKREARRWKTLTLAFLAVLLFLSFSLWSSSSSSWILLRSSPCPPHPRRASLPDEDGYLEFKGGSWFPSWWGWPDFPPTSAFYPSKGKTT